MSSGKYFMHIEDGCKLNNIIKLQKLRVQRDNWGYDFRMWLGNVIDGYRDEKCTREVYNIQESHHALSINTLYLQQFTVILLHYNLITHIEREPFFSGTHWPTVYVEPIHLSTQTLILNNLIQSKKSIYNCIWFFIN